MVPIGRMGLGAGIGSGRMELSIRAVMVFRSLSSVFVACGEVAGRREGFDSHFGAYFGESCASVHDRKFVFAVEGFEKFCACDQVGVVHRGIISWRGRLSRKV